jgi:hypothetical protein
VALGIDDWSQRKGHVFGTILVDLEAHKIVDLLPDRTADGVAGWLAPVNCRLRYSRPSWRVRRGCSSRRATGRAGCGAFTCSRT